MFFRDYKSKVVKGIDEDDLLEGMKVPENLSFYGEYSTCALSLKCQMEIYSSSS